jgi:hypothetical protein
MILPYLSAGRNPGLVGGLQAVSSGGAEGFAAAVVFVVGGDVAEALVQPGGVVELAEPAQLGLKIAWVGDLVQVWVLVLEVPEERLEPDTPGALLSSGG